jgi:hypothetical protein
MPLPLGRLSWFLPLLLATGCNPLQARKVESPLRPTQMSPDSIALEILSVRLPHGEPELNVKVWEEVDEQHLPAELRKRLAKSGFRVGIVGSQVPGNLAKLLDLKDRPQAMGDPQQINLADVQEPPRVTLRHLQTRPGQRSEIIASGVYERLPVLLAEGGELCGQTYNQAQGVFTLVVTPQSDGRVRLELTPELHHDQMRQQWVGDQAMWRLETSRPKRVFDDLRIAAVLSPGSMLLLGSQPDRAGSLGHDFFMEGVGQDNRMEQKLILVRLCQTQHDDLIAPPTGKLP